MRVRTEINICFYMLQFGAFISLLAGISSLSFHLLSYIKHADFIHISQLLLKFGIAIGFVGMGALFFSNLKRMSDRVRYFNLGILLMVLGAVLEFVNKTRAGFMDEVTYYKIVGAVDMLLGTGLCLSFLAIAFSLVEKSPRQVYETEQGMQPEMQTGLPTEVQAVVQPGSDPEMQRKPQPDGTQDTGSQLPGEMMQQSPASRLTCPSCGEPVEEDWTICRKCLQKL